jgi:hypothetical protein
LTFGFLFLDGTVPHHFPALIFLIAREILHKVDTALLTTNFPTNRRSLFLARSRSSSRHNNAAQKGTSPRLVYTFPMIFYISFF